MAYIAPVHVAYVSSIGSARKPCSPGANLRRVSLDNIRRICGGGYSGCPLQSGRKQA